MMSIESSPKKGSVCQTCLRNFFVHFRRPYKIGEPVAADYNGEFGFDWIRDEYVYPLTIIDADENKKDTVIKDYDHIVRRILNRQFDGGRSVFINEGLYLPAWLSIFATNCPGTLGSDQINRQGANLDIEIHQSPDDDKSALNDDGTILIFKSSNPCLKISTFEKNQHSQIVEEPLANFINSGRTSEQLATQKRFSYKKKKAINIICSGGALSQNEYILVQAKKSGTIKDVGMLLVAKNKEIFVIKLIMVDVKVNGKILEKPKNYEWELKNRIFNQCLMIADVVKKEVFDLDRLAKTDSEVRAFVKKWWSTKIKIEDETKIGDKKQQYVPVNEFHKKNTKDGEVTYLVEDNSEKFKAELLKLYETKNFKLLPINSIYESHRYVFFAPIAMRYEPIYEKVYDPVLKKDVMTMVEPGSVIEGSASFEADTRLYKREPEIEPLYRTKNIEWGKSVVIYADAPPYMDVMAHELSHTLGLLHTFQDHEMKFHKGFTDNIMDYSNTEDKRVSKFNTYQTIFRKIQADQITTHLFTPSKLFKKSPY